jgi:tetratricopeptide (TPR) repeat protein
MTATTELRRAIIGLVAFAAAEEQMLLAASLPGESGDATNWAALPLIAHNAEFRRQQAERLAAISGGQTPVEYPEIDHSSPQVYERYQAQPGDQVAIEASASASDLVSNLSLISDEDLRDPARNPWLKGRQLWLQIIVRGFWHPVGHLADYYLARQQPDRAVALAAHAVATASYLDAPAPARGMAHYNLACAQSKTGDLEQAAATIDTAIGLNSDLRINAARDPDLQALRDSGHLALLADRTS